MCLRPNIILNPNYSQHRYEFRYLSLASRIIEQKNSRMARTSLKIYLLLRVLVYVLIILIFLLLFLMTVK